MHRKLLTLFYTSISTRQLSSLGVEPLYIGCLSLSLEQDQSRPASLTPPAFTTTKKVATMMPMIVLKLRKMTCQVKWDR